ncbi:hypothetical protein J3Q64DRAFT_1703206 [Phycomyces blakesleeanus]|uniref:Uncharacterized protein n=2 Tax=Phycomyces blakesleeanus TaxID=4837 RepID=A0A167K8D3_PHYB8|nr:hypothetical protein PHYBLDRAFT_174167 [Phycomyces blakesleeanus NRRL 1555(-)]OAD67470.1 hypothetical protein PHYBLDRAFT_174167 [Phycomyces blakesleeanus NRRL 1555(-)]|eukprot:XP_018285510.1 hypothetical protein PHYBLDRAFT_174167 [Phycomyces blakesleeanus NRRL 1555(-)]
MNAHMKQSIVNKVLKEDQTILIVWLSGRLVGPSLFLYSIDKKVGSIITYTYEAFVECMYITRIHGCSSMREVWDPLDKVSKIGSRTTIQGWYMKAYQPIENTGT